MNQKTMDYRKELSKYFVDELKKMKEQGHSMWQQPWFSGITPQNGATGRRYRGNNEIFLRIITSKRGYADPRWYTFNQISDPKGYVHKNQVWTLKKGSKGVLVEYWYPYDLTDKKKVRWEDIATLEQNGHEIILSSYYNTVFNGSCIDGLPEFKQENSSKIKGDALIEEIATRINVPVLEDQIDQAFYRVDKDEVHLPQKKFFTSSAMYNTTALHELTHSTGHETRLNRKFGSRFYGEEYAMEELVAELGCAFTATHLQDGLEKSSLDNSVSYIDSWIKLLEKDANALPKAISMAEKASDYMLGKKTVN